MDRPEQIIETDQKLQNAASDQGLDCFQSSSNSWTCQQVVKWTCSNFRTSVVGI